MGSQVQPCVGADGHVYVCTNHRGWKQYSYGSLHDGKSFKEIWEDLTSRRRVMDQIEKKERFLNCTNLCKPHESNKAVWEIWKTMENMDQKQKDAYIEELNLKKEQVSERLKHKEFI